MGQLAHLMRNLEALEAPAAPTSAEASVWPVVERESAAAGVPPELVMAVIARESNFNPRAANYQEPRGGPSIGLMQVQLATAQQALRAPGLRLEDLFDVTTNVRAGVRYLADQLRTYRGDLAAAVAAYNAGSARRDVTGRYVNQAYVDAILARLGRYRTMVAGLAGAAAGAWPWLLGGASALLLGAGLIARQRAVSGR